MSGLDRTGPLGMGPMTGGARGWCSPYGRRFAGMGFGPWTRWGQGRGRGNRHRYWALGAPGWHQVGPMGPWGPSFAEAYTREQEVSFLKDQAAALREELEAIDRRLREIESKERESA